MHIREARLGDLAALSDLARRSKAVWGYDDSLLALWEKALTFTAETLATQSVWVGVEDALYCGVVALSVEGDAAELEHLWVEPSLLRRGVGRALLAHAVEEAKARGLKTLYIDADPHAEAFYLREGARRIGEVPARPEGRVLPRLALSLA